MHYYSECYITYGAYSISEQTLAYFISHLSNRETLFKRAYTCQVYYYLLLAPKFIAIEVVEVLIK
jgi:hypothetical protein